jgi:hypothetical protein
MIKECLMDNSNIFSLGMILGGILVGIAQTANYALKVFILKKDLERNLVLAEAISKMKADL